METVLYLLLDFGGSAVLSYFLGCFNGAVIVSKYILGDDVRNHGSGNAGLTNFYRTFGGPLTLVVILCDVLKAVIAVGLVGYCADKYFFDGWPFPTYPLADVFSKYWAGLWCLLGHMFPCMFHFKGGKGILSGGAIAIMIDWRIALVVWGGFLILAVAHQVCVPGLALGRSLLPRGHLVRLSGPGDRPAGAGDRGTGGLYAPGQHQAVDLWNREQIFRASQKK